MLLATEIKLDQIEKTYRGRNGCACGCNGEYYDLDYENIDPEQVLKEIKKHLKHINKNSERVEIYLGLKNQVILELQNPSGTSVTRIYMKAN
jgi:hypothetical protein